MIPPATRLTCSRSRAGTRGPISAVFASIYTTGRGKYAISYPNDPTALALPFSTEPLDRWRGCRHVRMAVLSGAHLAGLHRAATKSLDVPGRADGAAGRIDHHRGRRRRRANHRQRHGSRAPRRGAGGLPGPQAASRDLISEQSRLGPRPRWHRIHRRTAPEQAPGHDGPDPVPLLAELRKSWENRPENSGELRLVAWVPRPAGGQTVEPRSGPSPRDDGRAGSSSLRESSLTGDSQVQSHGRGFG